MWYACLAHKQDISDRSNKEQILDVTTRILIEQLTQILRTRQTLQNQRSISQTNEDNPHIFDFLMETGSQQHR